VGQASRGFLLAKFHGDEEDHPIVVLLAAVEHNQDSGIDDWTRLLIHSIFLNSLDEMQHYTSTTATNPNDSGSTTRRAGGEDAAAGPFEGQLTLLDTSGNGNAKRPLRSRHPQQQTA